MKCSIRELGVRFLLFACFEVSDPKSMIQLKMSAFDLHVLAKRILVFDHLNNVILFISLPSIATHQCWESKQMFFILANDDGG